MGGNHNLYCSGNQPDIVTLLRNNAEYPRDVEAADEIERLREEIASCTADIAREVSEGNRYMLEAAQLREQLAACQKDAERYRWLRSKERDTDGLMMLVGFNDTDELDAAIDAAMKEKP